MYVVKDYKWKVIVLLIYALIYACEDLGTWHWAGTWFPSMRRSERGECRRGWGDLLWLGAQWAALRCLFSCAIISQTPSHSVADDLLKCSHRELCVQRERNFQKTNYRWVHSSRVHMAQPSSH